ncbi:MAG: hypothetical protein ABIG34_03095 [Candidatus Peregrinibacteria bacterium]
MDSISDKPAVEYIEGRVTDVDEHRVQVDSFNGGMLWLRVIRADARFVIGQLFSARIITYPGGRKYLEFL